MRHEIEVKKGRRVTMTRKQKSFVTGLVIFALFCSLYHSPVCLQAASKTRLSKTKLTLNVGAKKKLKIRPAVKKVKWSSSKRKVATVSAKGVVHAKKKGRTVITARLGKKKYRCRIKVVEKKRPVSSTKPAEKRPFEQPPSKQPPSPSVPPSVQPTASTQPSGVPDTPVPTNTAAPQTGGKALAAYFAYSENIGDVSDMSVDAVTSASLNSPTENTEGNLQVMAGEIQARKGAYIHHILVAEPYDSDYSSMRNRVYDEIQNNIKPALTAKVDKLEQYDVVYIGTPVWSGSLPQPMITFMEENDFTGKTIVPFGINLGSGFGSIISQMRELCPGANVVDGFTINARTPNNEVRTQFDEWLDKLKTE